MIEFEGWAAPFERGRGVWYAYFGGPSMSAVVVSLLAARLGGIVSVDLVDTGTQAEVPTVARDAGTSEREVVRQVVRAHLAELRDCYEAELARSGAPDAGPAPNGTLKIRWTVGADGSVTSVEVLSASPGAGVRLAECVTDAIRSWRFPTPKAGKSVITYPFVFKAPPDAGQP